MIHSRRFNMLHTSIEVLAQQNKLRPRTQHQSRDGFPLLRKKTRREPLRAVRAPFTSEVFNPWPEDEENRPETPFVKTRLQRKLLNSGGSRPNVPCDTNDIFTPSGMYKQSLNGTLSPTIRMKSSGQDSSIRGGKHSNRCATPVPFYQPLTKLCWNNEIEEDSDSDDDDYFDIPLKHRQPQTPRHQTSSPFRTLRHANDVTVSDLENIEQLEHDRAIEPLNLTQKILEHYFQKKMSSTQRIVRWLADCEEKAGNSTLPAHLPDITYTCRT